VRADGREDRPGTGGDRKVAFVLSGGGNRGAMEVGVLMVLLEHGIRPHILVGTSVGAINAAAIAADPTVEGARWLESLWQRVTKMDVIPNSQVSMIWRLIKGEGLFPNQRLRDYLEAQFPPGVRTFGDLKKAELYITAADIRNMGLYVFGEDPSESILDAMMASSALPFFLSPWRYRGREFVDGAVVSDLPMRVAVNKGATEIYAIDAGARRLARWKRVGILRSIGRILDTVATQQVLDELEWVGRISHIDVHYIRVDGFEGVRTWDFENTAEMIERGREVGLEHLRLHGVA